ncbi:MAG: glycosyltransferase [Planctomycetota bacterium]|nr:MAG: glycosyltransferase [Planctomycetota bacterium]
MDVTIVVPVYNEQESVRPLYEEVARVFAEREERVEILFVDDGSTDGTAEELRRIIAADDRVRVIWLRGNFGQTAAMDAGIRAARGRVVVTMDGDLQNDPADIPEMLALIDQGYDLVHGWRKDRKDRFVTRILPSRIANWLIARVTGFPVHDLGCTLKAIRREVAQELSLYGEMHRFIPILAHWRGARCIEMVTHHRPRRFGTSKYGLSRTLRVLLDLITVKFLISYTKSPMRLFGGIGLACAGFSFVSGAATVTMKVGGTDMTGNPLLLLTVFAGLASIQFFSIGMLGELMMRTYYESQDHRPYAIRWDSLSDTSDGAARARAAHEAVSRRAA